VRQEILVAARALLKAPGITAAAVLTLALGIGANTGMFSIVYGVFARPLPYGHPSSLAVITAEGTFGGVVRRANYSAAELQGWQERSHAFDSIAMWGGTGFGLRTESGLEPVSGAFVSANFFATLDEPLALGRAIGPADDGSPVAVISHRLWTSRFNGDARALGRSLRLDGRPYTIIGVTRPDFAFPDTRPVLWTPVGYARALGTAPWIAHPRGGGFHFIGRMKPGVTLADARADAEATARSLTAEFPDNSRERRPLVMGLTEWVAGSVQRPFAMLSAAVLLMLLVTFANVINLVTVRNAFRSRDVAVRVAMGAGRGRLFLHSTYEAALIACAGGSLGVLIAVGSIRTLLWLNPAWLPRMDKVRIDAPVLAFALLLTTATAVVCAVAPFLQHARADVVSLLRTTASSQRSTPRGRRLQSALVVLEVAISVVLLVGALLLGRSLVRLLHTDIGVSTDHLIVAQLDLKYGRELSVSRQTELVDRLVERVRALPGIVGAGAGTSLPPDLAMLRYTLKQVPTPAGERDFDIDALAVTPEFFSTLRVPLVAGRFFSAADTPAAPPVMIMSAGTARRFFGADPLGRTLLLPADNPSGHETVTLVGIVGNVKYGGLESAADGGIYRPYPQQPVGGRVFVVGRTAGDPLNRAEDLRRAVGAVDPDVCVVTLGPLDAAVSNGVAQPRFRAVLLGSIAAIALVLASTGLYGILAYSVSRRVPEIGVRMALGATSSRITRMVLREGLALAMSGVALGALASYLLTRLLSTLLFGITSTDVPSFVSACAGMLALAALASYLPARRAARLDPIVSLRAE
jgi:putative ABC transport system permease protein